MCSRCGLKHEAAKVQTVCVNCAGTLFAQYDLEGVKNSLRKDELPQRPPSMWKYLEVLPVQRQQNIVSLGEGFTPIIRIKSLSHKYGLKNLLLKDDGLMPTGSFKARGMSSAISKLKELGVTKVALASAGNAAGAAAAYSARAGIEAHIFVPRDAPEINKKECSQMGAHVYLVDGLISDAAKIVSLNCEKRGWFNLSTLREPYRVEGKKTMGYEIAEQSDWELPDVIIYPTGGGTGLVGMWKAFDELQKLGWTKPEKPRMVCVQSEGCDPVVLAYESRRESVEPFLSAHTAASGLCVPYPYASEQILRVIRQSGGTAVAVSDEEIIESMNQLHREGLFVCPEGAATLSGLLKLLDTGWLDKNEKILLYNTGSGLKYPHLMTTRSFPLLPKDTKEIDLKTK
jgi:threonine synthase